MALFFRSASLPGIPTCRDPHADILDIVAEHDAETARVRVVVSDLEARLTCGPGGEVAVERGPNDHISAGLRWSDEGWPDSLILDWVEGFPCTAILIHRSGSDLVDCAFEEAEDAFVFAVPRTGVVRDDDTGTDHPYDLAGIEASASAETWSFSALPQQGVVSASDEAHAPRVVV